MPRESEGPTDIRIRNLPSDVREKLWKLKRINAIVGGPTEYGKIVIEALRCLFDSPEIRKRLELYDMIEGQLQQGQAQGNQGAEAKA